MDQQKVKSPSAHKRKRIYYDNRRRSYHPYHEERRYPGVVTAKEKICSFCKENHWSRDCNKAKQHKLEKMEKELNDLKNQIRKINEKPTSPEGAKEREDTQQDNDEDVIITRELPAVKCPEDKGNKNKITEDDDQDSKNKSSEEEDEDCKSQVSEDDDQDSEIEDVLEIKLDIEEQKEILHKEDNNVRKNQGIEKKSEAEPSAMKQEMKDLKKENANLKKALYLVCKRNYLILN